MKRTLILLLLLLFSNFIIAQEEEEKPSRFGFFIGGSWNMHDLKKLNNSLSVYNQENLENSTIGFCGGFLIGNIQQPLFFSVELAAAMQTPRSGASQETTFSTSSISINVNMNILKNTKYFLYPTIGFGFTSLDLQITDLNKISPDFNEALGNLSGERNLYTSPVYFVNLGFGFDRKFSFFSKNKSIFVGVRGGYKFKVTETEWGAGGYEIEDGPDVNIGGWYASISLSLF